jgi:hypothetical protein
MTIILVVIAVDIESIKGSKTANNMYLASQTRTRSCRTLIRKTGHRSLNHVR